MFAHQCIVPIREASDELVYMGCFCSCNNITHTRLRFRESNVLCYGRGEKNRVLQDHCELVPKICNLVLFKIYSVWGDFSLSRVKESKNEAGQCCLARAGGADDSK